MAICVDCDKTVEIDQNGKCISCGSSSIIIPQFNRATNALQPTLNTEVLLKVVSDIMELIGKIHVTMNHRAALQFISARTARMLGLSLGQHLENVITMWDLATRVEEAEKEEAGGKAN